jgi:hypothetical protein
MWNDLKEVWKDALANQILTMSTVAGAVLIYTRIFHPEIFPDIAQIVATYLCVKRG